MTADAARPAPSPALSPALTIAGIALIVAPLIAVAVKTASFGWLLVAMIWMLYPVVLLLLGWLVQIVIASTGCFGRRALFRTAGRRRAITATWVTTAGVLLTAFFFVDGADMMWGSTFMYWTGMASDDTAGTVSSLLAWIASVAWVGGWLWLVVEWIIALAARVRSRRRG